jgi:hypothetical protein
MELLPGKYACHSFFESYLTGRVSKRRILEHIVSALRTGTPPGPSNQPPSAGFLMSSGSVSATQGGTLAILFRLVSQQASLSMASRREGQVKRRSRPVWFSQYKVREVKIALKA